MTIAISEINIRNLLSFGPEGIGPEGKGLELRDINVLIGANGSGKSNFLDVLGLLQAAATGELNNRITSGGGATQWLWRGASANTTSASIEVKLAGFQNHTLLRYELELGYDNNGHSLVPKREGLTSGEQLILNYQGGVPLVYELPRNGAKQVSIPLTSQNVYESSLGYNWNPNTLPALAFAQQRLADFRFYLGWSFGRQAEARRLQSLGTQDVFLAEDASNLTAVLNNLQSRNGTGDEINEYLRYFYPTSKGYHVNLVGNPIDSLQLVLKEDGYSTAAARLSDGTLHWLSLLAVLLHPKPPAIVCFEEPEAGLHPDAIPLLGNLIRRAATRTQLFITTHSADLVDMFTADPSSVVVCNKRNGATHMTRLKEEPLRLWLEEYSLGQVWNMGIAGGRK